METHFSTWRVNTDYQGVTNRCDVFDLDLMESPGTPRSLGGLSDKK